MKMKQNKKVDRVYMERIYTDINDFNLERRIEDLKYCIVFFGLGDFMDDRFEEHISKIRDSDKLNQFEDDLDWMISSIELLKELVSNQIYNTK
jgi:hypothetical protein